MPTAPVPAEELEAGADAYITKPINFTEFLACVRALSPRIETQVRSGVVRTANLELDLENQTLRRLGVQVHLSPTEFSLLAYLMQNPGLPMDNKKLLRAIWGFCNASELDYVIQPYISRLRKKIEDNVNTPAYLLTVQGFGYRFCNQSQVAHNGTVACGDRPATSPSSSESDGETRERERREPSLLESSATAESHPERLGLVPVAGACVRSRLEA